MPTEQARTLKLPGAVPVQMYEGSKTSQGKISGTLHI